VQDRETGKTSKAQQVAVHLLMLVMIMMMMMMIMVISPAAENKRVWTDNHISSGIRADDSSV
jgi:preprotein translocase subunit YajC